MRKITKQAIAAFDSNTNFKRGNTEVRFVPMDGECHYLLHGHKIAYKNLAGDLYVNLCGWNTPTTRERLNGLKGVEIHTEKGTPYLNGNPISSTGYHQIV